MADESNDGNFGLSGRYALASSLVDAGTVTVEEGGGESGAAQGQSGQRDAGQNDLGDVDVGRTEASWKSFSFTWHNWENSIQDLADGSVTSIRIFGEGTHETIHVVDADYLARILHLKMAKEASIVLVVCESVGADGHGWHPPIQNDPLAPRIAPPPVVDHGALERDHHSRLAVGTSLRDTPHGAPTPTRFDDLPNPWTRKNWEYSLGRKLSVLLRDVYVQQYTTTSFAAASIMPFDSLDPEGARSERTVWRRGIRMELSSDARQ